MIKNKNNGTLTDAFWYAIGAIIPMTVLFVRSPIYTRIFSPEDYGYYSLVNITFTYLSSLSFAWITNCAWRYYLQYKNNFKLDSYYRILSTLYAISSIVLLLISGIWLLFAENYLLKRLIVYGCLYFTTNELINFTLVPIRIEGKSVKYNLYHSSRAVISFCLLLGLTFISHIGIESFFLAGAIINVIYLVIILGNKLFLFKIRLIRFERKDIKEFISYGSASIGINICLYFLINSDRYILALYRDIGEVGIYNQIYNIAQISLVSAINVYQAAINPKVFEKLESSDTDTDSVISSFAYKTFFLFLPLTIIVAIFAKYISYILLGPAFRDAYYILPFIAFGVFVNGMNYFKTSKFKFRNKVKYILIGTILATLINVGLNFILIPSYGIMAAAMNTLIAYGFLWLFYYILSDIKYLADKRYRAGYIQLISISILILAFYFFDLKNKLFSDCSLFHKIALSAALLVLFFILTLKINPFVTKPLLKYFNRMKK